MYKELLYLQNKITEVFRKFLLKELESMDFRIDLDCRLRFCREEKVKSEE